MPPIRFFTLKRRAYIVIVILLLGEIMPTYFCCVLKGLTYIIIIAPSNRQPFFYAEYTKSNMCSSCEIWLVSTNKYIFLYYYVCCCAYCSLLIPYLSYYRVSGLISGEEA